MRFGILAFIFLAPLPLLAACTEIGATVVYINGVFTSDKQAGEDLQKLQRKFIEKSANRSVFFKNAYNPSRLEGLGDLAQAYSQIIDSPISTFDRDTILFQIHSQITTRKLLLVGHSQGTFYTNEIYKYLLENGEPREAVGVYNIASPAKEVAGNGLYLNSTNDSLLNLVQGNLSNAILPRNIVIPIDLGDITSKWPGHGITKAYLQGAPDRIVEDIESSLEKLQPLLASNTAECFSAPERSLSYNTRAVLFGAGDTAAKGLVKSAVVGWNGAIVALNGVKTGLAAVGTFFDTLTNIVTPKPQTENLPGSFTLFRGIYGSSVTEEDLKDFLRSSQGGAVALAFEEEEPEEGLVKGAEIEKPFEPLIPPPTPGALASPGFGGGGGGSVSESPDVPAPSLPSTPAQTLVVPDGTPPSLVSILVNGVPLQASYASIAQAPLATSGTLWHVQMEFDESLSVGPTVQDKPPGASPLVTTHSVNDCGDTDVKTYCLTFAPPLGMQSSAIESREWWNFEISGGADMSGEVMTSVAYAFAIDTLAPSVFHGATGRSSALPVIDGTVSADNMPVQVLVNGNFFSTQASANYWFVSLVAGQELSEGYVAVQASSSDPFGNLGAVAQWQVLIDLIAPTVLLTPDITDGASVASTTSVVAVSVTDNNAGVTHVCVLDGIQSNSCTGFDVSALTSGAHAFQVTATDVGGHQTVLSRTFTVLP
jgi:hypothetical protein